MKNFSNADSSWNNWINVSWNTSHVWEVTSDINTIISSGDVFLIERSLQPKRRIRSYIRENWGNTPNDYRTLAEAMATCEPFILNSEHPQEYAGVSGLAESYVVNPLEIIELQRTKSREELSQLPEIPSNLSYKEKEKIVFEILLRIGYVEDKEIFQALFNLNNGNFKNYAHKMNLELEDVMNEQSYSISKYIPGINHTVIWDADIPWKYYIVSTRKEGGKTESLVLIIENWVISISSWWQENILLKSVKWIYLDLIKEYEWIRWLEKFDKKHFPIIEFQSSADNNIYSLQYHRCRDWSQVQENFELNRGLECNEIESVLFRWVTPPEWIIARTFIVYPDTFCDSSYLLDDEEWSFDKWIDPMYSELMCRKRKVSFFTVRGNEEIGDNIKIISNPKDPHLGISRFFKSDLFVSIPENQSYKLIQENSPMALPRGFPCRKISRNLRCLAINVKSLYC